MPISKGLQVSEQLALPLSAVTATMVVLGGKGMGKTNLGGVLVEAFSSAGLRWSVIDPMGVWWGIRHAADGVGKGVECLILGGANADIPIEPTGGAVVADLVADEQVNVIIDISRKASGEMWSIGERIRFMVEYGKQLYKRQGSLLDGKRREPICQVIDEAARFIPQVIRSNEENVAACAGIWSAIVEEGRNVGIGVVMLTQRNARLNKDVAELADVMFAFRTIGPKSLDAVMEWLGAHLPKQELHKLSAEVRGLPVGSCLAVSPGWLQLEKVVAIRKRWTFDSSATPKPGESQRKVRGAGAKPDLARYSALMAETIERAKKESVPDLQKRIRELEMQAAKPALVTAATAAPRQMTEREKAALVRPFVLERKRIGTSLEGMQAKFARVISAMQELQTFVEDRKTEVLANLPVDVDVPQLTRPMPAIAQAPKRADAQTPKRPDVQASKSREVSPSGVRLTGKAMQVASIAAGYGDDGITKKLLAAIMGVPMNGSFYNRISDARIAGAITTSGDVVLATEDGIEKYYGEFQAPTNTEQVLALWRPKLTGKAREILDVLVAEAGAYISRTDLAARIGVPTNGSFYNRLSDVRLTGLLREEGKDVAVNPKLLFL